MKVLKRSEIQTGKTVEERHDMRRSWFIAEAARQAANRAQQAKTEAMYNGKHYTAQEAQELRDRGQNPVVYNEMKPAADWMIGTQRRQRTDFYIVAEEQNEDAEEEARIKTKLLKYLDDTSRAQFERSYAWNDAVKAGIGWLEVALRGDPTGPIVFTGHEPWRNILWDSRCRPDLSDCRYLFRLKPVDLDVALALFPEKEEQICRVAQEGDQLSSFTSWLGINGTISGLDDFNQPYDLERQATSSPVDSFNPRQRVLLIECWSREPVRRQAQPGDTLTDPIEMKIRVSIMTEHDTLIESWSPYKHDRFPFVPIWGYRDEHGLPYSMLYQLIGPQESLNHRMSKSLFEASSNQLMLEASAIDETIMSLDEIRDESQAPDGTMVFKDGALSAGRVKPVDRQNKAQSQLLFADRDMMHIRGTSGVNEVSRGMRGSATSGVGMEHEAERSTIATTELFDNLLLAHQLEGEIKLSLAEQYMVEPRMVQVAGEGGQFDRVWVNQPDQTGRVINDINARRHKFVIGEASWKQSLAQAAFEKLMEMLTQLASVTPQVVVSLLDVVFEMHPDLPRKKTILERIRAINGQRDENGKVTPEQEAAMAKQQQMAEAQTQAQLDLLLAQVAKLQAEGKAVTAKSVQTTLTAMYEAAQAAQVLAQVPQTVPIADELLRSSGFQDQAGEAPGIPQPAPMPVPQEQPAQQPMPQMQQADGAMQGIETPAADGEIPQGA